MATGCALFSSHPSHPEVQKWKVVLVGCRVQILGALNLYHALACMPAAPAAPAHETPEAFLQHERAVGNAGAADVEVAFVVASHVCAWEVFLDAVPVGVQSVQIVQVEAVGSSHEHFDCTSMGWICK